MFTQTHATSPLNSYVIGYIDDDPFFSWTNGIYMEIAHVLLKVKRQKG